MSEIEKLIRAECAELNSTVVDVYATERFQLLYAAFTRLADAAVQREWGSAIARIAAERTRQMSSEHWTPEHDDEHKHGELAIAAACYASPEPTRARRGAPANCGCRSAGECTHDTFPRIKWTDPWPWSEDSDKRKKHSRIRQLEIAGALIAAEIERLERAAIRKGTPE